MGINKKPIGVFTNRSLNPLHPRLYSMKLGLEEMGFEVDFITNITKSNSLLSRINWLSLWFFDLYGILRLRKFIGRYDLVFVMDLRLLPLVKIARRRGCKVIYETLDNNVHLRFYQLSNRFSFFKLFKGPIISLMTKIEKHYAFKYCDNIIVNSKALKSYFEDRANLLYYYSPLEEIGKKNNPDQNPAFLYLGEFSKDKGAEEVLEIQKRYNLPLFIIGNIESNDVVNSIRNDDLISYYSRMDIISMQKLLIEISGKYFLIGTSLIKPVHYSYETQEANKEIDYMSMGIPFIGNHRLPTGEKIMDGCGVFSNDDDGIMGLINNPDVRRKMSDVAFSYYQKHYQSELYNMSLNKIVKELY